MHPLETLMHEEIIRVKNSGNFTVKYDITCVVHTPTHNFGAIMVTDLSLLRDYINKFSDVLSVTAVFTKGIIIEHILPNAKELEATITLKPLASVPDYTPQANTSISEYKFKAILYENPQDIIKSNLNANNGVKMANAEDVGYLQFQLVTPVQEAIRTKTFGGVIRGASGIDAIRAILSKYSKVEGVDNSFTIKGIDVQDGYTKEICEHIAVPHLTPIVRVPKIIEELAGGIYPTGMSYYLQQSYWYIWSPYDINRYGTEAISMTVFNIPENKLAQIEKTFRTTPNQLIILSTGKVEFQSIEEKTLPNEPPAVRFVDSRTIMGGFGETGGNKLVVDARKNINEFQDKEMASLNTKNLATEAETRITDNYLLEYGKLAKRRGALLQFVWEYSVDSMIYPGMPVRFVYMNGNEPRQIYGTVVAVESAFQSITPGMLQRRYVNKSIVSLFVADKIDDNTMQ